MGPIVFLLAVWFFPYALVAKAPNLVRSWQTTQGLDRPESAHFSSATGNVYVTNVAGRYGVKDGRGWITQILAGGTVLTEKWVEGLNAPKGLDSSGDVLWISDIDELVLVDINKAKIIKRILVPGARYLNGITMTGPEEAYVTDSELGRIYVVGRGRVEVFLESPQLKRPNGIAAVSANQLVVVTSGDRNSLGSVFTLSTQTKKLEIISRNSGRYDGVAVTNDGKFLVTDYKLGELSLIHENGDKETVLSGLFGPAGIDYGTQGAFAVVAESEANRVSFYDSAKEVRRSGLSH